MTFPITRRAALALPFLPALAHGQPAWTPDRPLRIVVPFGPGTLADGAARLLAEHIAPRFGRPVVIDNKGGATTTIGAAEVARAAPDGHTLLMVPPPFVITQFAMRLPYDPEAAFRPVGLVATSPIVLAVRGELPARDVPELLALARARPGALTYASVGIGSLPHLAGELFRLRAGGIDLLHVPYATGVLAGNDLVAGRVDMVFTSELPIRAFLDGGRVRIIAVAAPRRLPQRPEVPTLGEFMQPLNAAFWIGLLAPARTPDAAVVRWNAEVNSALNDPSIVERLARLDLTAAPGTPEDLATLLREERQQWGEAVRAGRVSLE
jgi:tripartite-type tricarboxylate transporter receptor subunit TctC